MKKTLRLIAGMVVMGMILAAPQVALANCTTHTIMSGGRVMTCTTCCAGGYCNTSCF